MFIICLSSLDGTQIIVFKSLPQKKKKKSYSTQMTNWSYHGTHSPKKKNYHGTRVSTFFIYLLFFLSILIFSIEYNFFIQVNIKVSNLKVYFFFITVINLRLLIYLLIFIVCGTLISWPKLIVVDIIKQNKKVDNRWMLIMDQHVPRGYPVTTIHEWRMFYFSLFLVNFTMSSPFLSYLNFLRFAISLFNFIFQQFKF